jgi:hypothetical protein
LFEGVFQERRLGVDGWRQSEYAEGGRVTHG